MNTTQSKTSQSKTSSAKGSDGQQNPKEKSVGDALRAVYHEAIDEEVPDSMLDLLSKLG